MRVHSIIPDHVSKDALCCEYAWTALVECCDAFENDRIKTFRSWMQWLTTKHREAVVFTIDSRLETDRKACAPVERAEL